MQLMHSCNSINNILHVKKIQRKKLLFLLYRFRTFDIFLRTFFQIKLLYFYLCRTSYVEWISFTLKFIGTFYLSKGFEYFFP